ncbi:hypothetical protein AKJ66_03295 [candidate division MSBL1 archaeon SCGC-AAA259E22]|uniref:Adenosylcobinamide-GDP ribazoletransferase n=1 Tax=candidate division MSBL1 archaeon SCGC-AAA259E22 TaxID=1698265 RepID=A0A133UFE3_9EURY|nr:hypothetical protein AKJ66_03295 [candidate division MSBL1 archaeon SCGC-AAA259E22]
MEGLKGSFSFLTTIPVGGVRLKATAEHMYLFPLVGGFIGLATGAVALVLFHFFPSGVASVLTVGAIFAITGLHHTDGLLDFGDGLMAFGSPEEKIEIMRDKDLGAGGMVLGLLVILATVSLIPSFEFIVLKALIVSEVSAKFSMVFGSRFGKSASEGLNSDFLEAMEGSSGNCRFVIAILISIALVLLTLGLRGLVPLIAGVVVASLLISAARSHFGGVTGDVLGTVNEVTRMGALLSLKLVM